MFTELRSDKTTLVNSKQIRYETQVTSGTIIIFWNPLYITQRILVTVLIEKFKRSKKHMKYLIFLFNQAIAVRSSDSVSVNIIGKIANKQKITIDI